MALFSQGHAVLVGVGADLAGTVTDAQGMATLLMDPERCAYPPDQVHVLTEGQATRVGILNQLEQLAKQVNAESTVILYFSGHGYEVDTGIGKHYFLIPYGYDATNLVATAISDHEFMAKIQAIQAQKMLVLLDCCHASGLDNVLEKAPTVKSIKAPLPASAAAVLAKGRGRIIISSCKEHEKSYTGKPYSQFTQALLEALTGAGLSQKDGFVRATDLALYAAKTVPLHTQNQQNPDLHFAQADNFAVAYYAGGGAEAKGLPPSAQRQTGVDTDSGSNQTTSTTHISINQSGGGAVASGDNAKAAGEGGVVADAIHGGVMTGKHARKVSAGTYIERQQVDNRSVFNQSGQTVHGNQVNIPGNVNTGGGLFNVGDINTGGGDFVGRDKNVHGEEVRGDKKIGEQIRIGNVSSSNLAVGRGAQLNVNTNAATADILRALQPILLAAQAAPADKREEATQRAEQLKEELNKGKAANDEKIGGLLDDLAKLLPNAVNAIGAVFGQPLLAGLAGPVTTFILKRLGIK
jgi:hypothetical protein